MSPPEAGWRFGKQPGGPDHEDGGSGKKDGDPGTLDERPGTKKSRREARKRAVQAKWPSGNQKTGRETKIAVRMTKSRARTEKTPPGCGKLAPGAGFFDKRRTSGGRRAGPSSWRSCTHIEANGANGRDVPSPFQHNAGRPPTSGRLFGGHAGP